MKNLNIRTKTINTSYDSNEIDITVGYSFIGSGENFSNLENLVEDSYIKAFISSQFGDITPDEVIQAIKNTFPERFV